MISIGRGNMSGQPQEHAESMERPASHAGGDYIVESVPQFLGLLGEKPFFPALPFRLFRGEGDISWDLLCKAGRTQFRYVDGDEKAYDRQQFEKWVSEAVAYTSILPEDVWEQLACAQHYGLATRLLDWTRNPLVALFFAVDEQIFDASKPMETPVDGRVYWYLAKEYAEYSPGAPPSSPFDRSSVCAYLPRPIDRRVLSQNAAFTCHPRPSLALYPEQINISEGSGVVLSESNLISLRIPGELKEHIKYELNSIGISRKTLFPDLDGLSAWHNWALRRGDVL